MRILLAVLLSAALLASGRPGADGGAAGPDGRLAVVNGRVFDGKVPGPARDLVVVIEGGRIVQVGPPEDVDLSGVTDYVDAGGGFVMPGVIDAHVHVFFAGLPRGEDLLTPWLEAGVTTLVDVGTMRHTVRATRALAKASGPHTPRLFVSGPILTPPGGYPATRYEEDVDLYAQPVQGVEQIEEVVADLIDLQGADLVKIAIEAGFDADYDAPVWPVFDAEELAAITAAAHARGRNVFAHVSQPLELQAAVRAGVDVAAHPPIAPVPAAILEEAARNGMIFVSTANIWVPEHTRVVLANLAAYHAMGGRIALGTDFPFQDGSAMPVDELLLLAEAGLTPAEVLVAATRNAAAAVGRAHELGTLESGKLADVLVVDGDPLTDLHDLAKVKLVLQEGKRIRPVTRGPEP